MSVRLYEVPPSLHLLGGSLIEVFKTFGLSLVIAGAIVTTTCTISTFLFSHFVLKLNVAPLLAR